VQGGNRVTTNLSSSEVRWRIDNAGMYASATSRPSLRYPHYDQNDHREQHQEHQSPHERHERQWTWTFGNSVQGLCDLSVINFMERHRLYTSNPRDIALDMKVHTTKTVHA
jgi:hypothetical protein